MATKWPIRPRVFDEVKSLMWLGGGVRFIFGGAKCFVLLLRQRAGFERPDRDFNDCKYEY